MSPTRRYTIILEPDPEEGGYTVTVPALPGCITQGETIEQCIERAREAIAGYIESLISEGEPVPEETEPPQMITINVAA
jgi:antitoxin HicB